MENYNLNATSSNLNNYDTPFSAEKINSVSNPITSRTSQPEEFASKERAYATRATAMAQILIGSDLQPNMTQRQYVNQLIKQGKIPNKHFFIKENECNTETYVEEVNSKGERTKEVSFPEGDVACSFYNPTTQKIYKAIETYNGETNISINDPKTGHPISDEKYREDGSLDTYTDYRNNTITEFSKDGKAKTYENAHLTH